MGRCLNGWRKRQILHFLNMLQIQETLQASDLQSTSMEGSRKHLRKGGIWSIIYTFHNFFLDPTLLSYSTSMHLQSLQSYDILLSDTSDGSFFLDNRLPVFRDWIVPDQVHGTRILTITDRKDITPESLSQTDGIISNLRGQIFGVKLADCNGIIILWKEWYAVLHAGWRGLAGGIIGQAFRKLEESGESTHECQVFCSPSIRACCYEVGESFREHFPEDCFNQEEERIHLDMIAYIQKILQSNHIPLENIHIDSRCTCCDHKYYSYRRDKTSQRMVFGVRKK